MTKTDIAIDACFKSKRSTKYCRLKKQHKGEKAAPCKSCFELGASVSDCRQTHGHCGPWVTWQTAALKKEHTVNDINKDIPQCCYELAGAFITESQASVPVDPDSPLAYLGPQTPQDYGTGFIINYTKDNWQAWLKAFELQMGMAYKMCTSMNTNKKRDIGVLQQGIKCTPYTVTWLQQYTCHRGGQPRYKDKENIKPQNAPGSRLTQCKATINVRLSMIPCSTTDLSLPCLKRIVYV